MKRNIILLILVLYAALTGCKKYLDVKISDRVTEAELYTTTQGFQSALNGIYIGMATDQLYGKGMSAGVIDVMAQYYFAPTAYQPFKLFQYTDVNINKPYFNTTWQNYYILISNANTVIDKCNTTTVLSATNNNIIKGEALAIRAFLHFDVLRLWGPIYSQATKTQLTIPYNKDVKPVVNPFLSTDAVLDNVIADLTQAMDLLKASDPVVTQGRRNASDLIIGDFTSFRQYRLNYFAVKALLARVYLWRQDTANARKYALEVIQDAQTASGFFPFVTNASAMSASNPDRIFSTEVLFAAYDNTRTTMFNNLLAPTASVRVYIQGDATGRANEMYDDKNDYRFLSYASQLVSNISNYYNRKYESISVTSSTASEYNNYIPLIRISEMYYIAAETAPTVAEGVVYLNKVRAARSARDLVAADATALNLALRNEYRREFISEGQLFFYYKRRSLTSVPDGSSATANITISLVNYVVPMVDSEINLRN